MTANVLFYIIITIIVLNFLKDKVINALNAKHFNDPIPKELENLYDTKTYKTSQAYKNTNYKFGIYSSLASLAATLGILFCNGFEYIDAIARNYAETPIGIALIFFGIIALLSDIISTPFTYYKTFVIEARYGFNKTTKKTFILDKVKNLIMTLIIGASIMGLIIWFYQITTNYFWLYAWGCISLFSIFINMFYARLIVPIFNTQSPLKDGPLKQKISNYAKSVGFSLNKIYVIDGSKRSSKANAYFSGFGNQKRITLYDTLINDLEDDEIVAVLAHEVGHYKQYHIIYNLILSIFLTGMTFYVLSIFISNPILSNAIGVTTPSFHAGLIAFGLLYAPISEITNLITNFISRRFEYQADNYAKTTYNSTALISALKKLSKSSLSNLTPHKFYVFTHYSHPSLLDRLQRLIME